METNYLLRVDLIFRNRVSLRPLKWNKMVHFMLFENSQKCSDEGQLSRVANMFLILRSVPLFSQGLSFFTHI